MIKYTQNDLLRDVRKIANWIEVTTHNFKSIFGVPRGGRVPATILSSMTGLPIIDKLDIDSLIIDDVVDSGKTRSDYPYNVFVSLHEKPTANPKADFAANHTTDWIHYFWEDEPETAGADTVRRQIQFIGDNPDREGLIETPARVIRSFDHLYSGYKQDPDTLFKMFSSEEYDQLVILKNIEFYSMCEHHILPFFGQAHVAYIPNGKIVGISKLARLVDVFARRLQNQERLGQQVVDCIMRNLQPIGAACILQAKHLCMMSRGVEKQNAIMETVSLKGIFLQSSIQGQTARQELMTRIK